MLGLWSLRLGIFLAKRIANLDIKINNGEIYDQVMLPESS
jgi:hypothetical protein